MPKRREPWELTDEELAEAIETVDREREWGDLLSEYDLEEEE